VKRIVFLILAVLCLSVGCSQEDATDLWSENIYPSTNNTYDIGSPTLQYQDGYFVNVWASNNVTATNNMSATYFIGNGSQLTGIESGGGVGGLYGINVETLAGAKTLTVGTDEIYQWLNGGGFTRVISLSKTGATASDRFIIKNNNTYSTSVFLDIKNGVGGSQIDFIPAMQYGEFIYDGTNWVSASVDSQGSNIGIGNSAWAYNYGVAIGENARGYRYGVAVGRGSDGNTYGIGIGYDAIGATYGTAIGYGTRTNGNRYSIALGYYSSTSRCGETSINIDGTLNQNNNAIQVRWSKETTNNVSTEMLCGGVAAKRCTIRASSVLSFELQVVARDNTANEVARYSFEGLIKRDGSNNTVLSWSSGGADYEDDAAWDCTISADDTNEALIITVTGDASNTTQWAAVLDGVETHF
jgi:hypothetical protein